MTEPEIQHLRSSVRSGEPLPSGLKDRWLGAVDAEMAEKPAPSLMPHVVTAAMFGGIAAVATSPSGAVGLTVAVALASVGYGAVLRACGDHPGQLTPSSGPGAAHLDPLEGPL